MVEKNGISSLSRTYKDLLKLDFSRPTKIEDGCMLHLTPLRSLMTGKIQHKQNATSVFRRIVFNALTKIKAKSIQAVYSLWL